MAGLHPHSQTAITKWQQLFKQSGNDASVMANYHWQQFVQHGLPNRKSEHWKYTSLDRLLSQTFLYAATIDVDKSTCAQLALDIDAIRLVFINGHFQPELSVRHHAPFVLETCDTPTIASPLDAVQPELFLHLSESLAKQHLMVHLAAHEHAPLPLYILHLSSGGHAGLSCSYPRVHLHLHAGAHAQIIEHYVSLDNTAHFTGARLTMQLENNARLTHTKLAFENANSFHFSHNDLRLQRDAHAQSHSFLLGGELIRHHTSAQLQGENGQLEINSLQLPAGRQIGDSRTNVWHSKTHGNSRQLHRAVVRDRARAIFNGLIHVAPNAIKTDAQMTNNNLLLDPLAEADAKPQLEIYADDVKCSHGATVGRISAEQMFYLRARGIDKKQAERIIINAFAAELAERLTEGQLKEAVMARIALYSLGENDAV